jgi:hypothetical protein
MKFSIRDVLFVTVIAALALGWGLDRARQTDAAPLPPAPTPAADFRLIVMGTHNDKLMLYNSQTGAVWERTSNGIWSAHTASLPESKRRP